MKKTATKPSPEAKALSLFLMAYKNIEPSYKEKLKRINKQWDLVKDGQVTRECYMEEVHKMLDAEGGYTKAIEKTVRYYIDKTGEWTLKGEDKYCQDAQQIVDSVLKEIK